MNQFDQFDSYKHDVPVVDMDENDIYTAIGGNPFDQFDTLEEQSAPAKEQFGPKQNITKIESLGRGAFYGALQQPRDVIASGVASISPDLTFTEALQMAKEMSLEGRQGKAQQANPGWFTGGQVAGNIATTLIPASAATKVVGMAAPALSKAPVVGNALSKLASGIGASKGLVGVPAAGAIQGGTSTLMTEGDLSGVVPGTVGAGIIGSVGKVMRPIAENSISAARKGFVDTLKKAGITDLTPGQLTGNSALETIDAVLSKLPFTSGAARKKAEAQLRKFTGVSLQKAGHAGDDIGPAARGEIEEQFTNRYNSLINNEIVNIDEPVLNKISEIAAKQLDKLPTNVKPIVKSYMKDILRTGGKMSGEAYQTTRSAMTQQSRSLSTTDTYTAGVLKDLRNALDGAAERSLPEAKKGAWRELQKQYANYKSIQKASTSVSKDSLEGILSPSALLSAVETANKTKGQAGYGELYDIARAGRGVLADTVPDSGTAQRLFYQNLMIGGVGGLGVGGATYGKTQDPQTAAIAAVLALGGPKAVQAFLNSKAGQAYFTKGIKGGSAASSPLAKSFGALGAASLANSE